MKILRILFLLLSPMIFVGCASITGTSGQSVSVETRDETSRVAGANCEMTNSKGKWFVSTPGSVQIKRSNDDLLITCQKDGYPNGSASVVSDTKGSMFGNILIGGGIGAIVDHNTGAAYEYPTLLQVIMGRSVSIGSQPTVVPTASAATQTSFVAAEPNLAPNPTQSVEQTSQSPIPQPNPGQAPGSGRRLALVIGNSNYSSIPALPNATNDSREIAKVLQGSGFEVMKYENLDFRQMQDVVRTFGEKLGKNDVGLFYFAGHGVQVKGRNYLIPVKENIKKSFEVPSGALDADLVLATMENAKNNLNIMILDACRSPFPGESRSLSRGLATLDAAKGTLIAYATAPGKEAMDGKGSNSPYTKNLVKALQQQGISIEQVFKQVRIAVVEETNGAQVPWENSSIMGEFYFRK